MFEISLSAPCCHTSLGRRASLPCRRGTEQPSRGPFNSAAVVATCAKEGRSIMEYSQLVENSSAGQHHASASLILDSGHHGTDPRPLGSPSPSLLRLGHRRGGALRSHAPTEPSTLRLPSGLRSHMIGKSQKACVVKQDFYVRGNYSEHAMVVRSLSSNLSPIPSVSPDLMV